MSLRIGIGVGMIPQQARPVPTSEPVNTSAPFFPAPLTQGQTVAINPGTWEGLPSGAFEYKRQRWNGSTWVDVGAFSSSPNVTFDGSDVAAGANGVRPVVRATNAIGPTTANGTAASIAATLTISGTPTSPNVGTAYNFTPASAGGHTPKSFALTGTLPDGLSFSPSTGAISGTPTTSGTASGLNITVTDADGLTASLGTFSLTVTNTPAISEWPNYSVSFTEDLSTYGSSTETAWPPTPVEWIKTDYAPTANYITTVGTPSGVQCLMNWAAGGSNSTDMVTAITGAPARVKAATGNILVGGAYETNDDPVPGIITNVGLAVAAAGHTNFVIAPKHHDGATIAASGQGSDWHRAKELIRRLGAPNSPYYGWVVDTPLFNRRFSTPRDATDIATKLTDRVQNSWWGGSPPSNHTDTAHMQGDDVGMGYYGGSHARAQYCQAPYYASRVSGMPAFIPHQTRHSTEKATFQAANGFVCNIATRGSLTGHTCDVFYADGSSVSGEWAVAIVGGVLKLYRGSTATKNNNGYTVLKVRIIKDGKANWAFVKVFLIDLTPDGTESAFLNSQWIVKENPYGSSISGPKFSFALALRARSASSTQKTFRAGQGTGGGGPFMEIKATANQNMGVSMANTSGGTGFNFDQPTAQGFTSARGLQWLFGCFDTSTAGAATGGGTGKVRTDSLVSGLSAVSTTGTCNLGTDLRIYLRGSNLFSVIGSFTAAGSRLVDMDVIGLWEADDYVDWGNAAMMDLVRDPTTRRPLLGTTRGSDTPGKVNGVAPRLWMQGPAGNWAGGVNLANVDVANGTGFWDATDRVDPEGGVAITTVNT